MDPNQEIEDLNELADVVDADETVSVDDFIKELEAKEKDLHITADTTFIELEDTFDDTNDVDDFKREAAPESSIEILQPPVPQLAARPPASAEHETTIRELREQIEAMNADRDEMFKSLQRRARDLDNLKSRAERERKETFQAQVGNLATQMLPALDNLNRALDFAGDSVEEKGAEFKQFYDGIVLVNEQVNDVFERMGVTMIQTVGREFDPHLHEAVTTEINDDLPPNTISEELMRGYRMGDKIIRHSMVKVSQPASAARQAKVQAEETPEEVIPDSGDEPA